MSDSIEGARKWYAEGRKEREHEIVVMLKELRSAYEILAQSHGSHWRGRVSGINEALARILGDNDE